MSPSLALRVGLIALVGVGVYLNSLSGPFLFDDYPSIVANTRIRQLWPPVDALAPLSNSPLASRPLVNLSFAVNYAIGGVSVRGYHVGNIAIHIAASLVLFLLVRAVLTGPAFRDRFLPHAGGLALSVAVIWMVHPLQTEAVDYVTQRTELMMGLSYLLTIFCAIRALRSERPDLWHLAAIVSCLIGAGSKESIATAPLIVLLYDVLFEFRSLKDALLHRWRLYGGLALSWVALAMMVSSRNSTVGFGAGMSAWTYLLNQAVMIGQYLKLAVWPYGLVLDYGFPRDLTLGDVLPQAALVVTLLLLTVAGLARRHVLGFCGAWFFVTLAPTSSVIPILTEVGAERRMYLPLAAIVVVAVSGLHWLARKAPADLRRPLAAAATVAVVVWLGQTTTQRNRDYASTVAVLQTSVDHWPHGRVRFNLAHALRAAGRRDEATAHLRAAVHDNPQAQYMLASDLYDGGEFDEAIAQLRAFTIRKGAFATDVVAAHNLIGLALAQQGQTELAISELQKALSADPDNADLHGNLAFLFLQQRQFELARRHYEQYLRQRRGSAFILTGLGTALAQLGRSDEAMQAYRAALTADPSHVEARARLEELGGAKTLGQ